MTAKTKNCAKCGAPFTMSRNDATVNCPACRKRPRAAGTADVNAGYVERAKRNFELGKRHALDGTPKMATSNAAYLRGYDDAKSEPTNPDNAGERRELGALIAELANDDYVTTTEAAEVVAWCREWLADGDTETVWDGNTDAHVLHACQRHIDGGLRFVLDDVRACTRRGVEVLLDANGITADGSFDPAKVAKPEDAEDAPTMPSEALYAPLRVVREHSGTEDGYLWYVVTEDGTRAEDAGHVHKLSAACDAVTLAAELRAKPAPWADLPQSTRDGYAARWAREAYAPDVPELVTDAQALTLVTLAEHVGEAWQCAPSVSVDRHGTNGGIVAVFSADSPAPNPVVRLWAGGDSYSALNAADYVHYLPRLRAEHGRVIVQRADDSAYVIAPGGTYEPLASVPDSWAGR